MNFKKLSYLIIILLMGFVGVLLYKQPATLTDKEKNAMDTLFESTKSQCIGRYVFDVPVSFVNTQHGAVMLNEYRIETQRMYLPAFEQMINLRENELKSIETYHSKDAPFLKNSIALPSNLKGVIFDRNQVTTTPGYGRILEGHLYKDGVTFKINKEFNDLSNDKYKKKRAEYIDAGVSDKFFTSASVQVDEMEKMLALFSGRMDTDIPTSPGSCIPDGFFRNTVKAKERMGLLYDTGFNVDFSVMTNNYLREKNSLKDRTSGVSEVLSQINGNIIKNESRLINGIKVDELLTVGEKRNGPGRLYQFMLIANEKNADFLHPIISVSLQNFTPEETSLSDAQVIDLWDRIVRTIRIRPDAF